MNNSILHSLFAVRKELNNPKYDKGEITGKLLLTSELVPMLEELADNNVIDDLIVIDGKSTSVKKIISTSLPLNIDVTLFTKNLQNAKYYETFNEFIIKNGVSEPDFNFGIYKLDYIHNVSVKPDSYLQYEDVLKLIYLLENISDFTKEDIDGTKELVFFHKKKLSLIIGYTENTIRRINYLDQLDSQFFNAHDRDERIAIFKSELISSLYDISIGDRFSHLLNTLDALYDNYLKSHLLYLEKFSYHDLKSEVDDDKLDFTKKIYGVVNDIQSKLIAVPAAYLLVLSTFDFTGQGFSKNLLITIGSILFAILLETLLSNQFGILAFIKKEISHFTNDLSNKDTKLDLSDFVKSFGDLDPVMNRQKCYLWVFRVIIWLVPVTSLIMLFQFNG